MRSVLASAVSGTGSPAGPVSARAEERAAAMSATTAAEDMLLTSPAQPAIGRGQFSA
jgi:hypothetical protein